MSRIAHDAYRKSIDAMTPGEIRALLEKYDIGAQPLSNLLGWGANTIDRQIRHTIRIASIPAACAN